MASRQRAEVADQRRDVVARLDQNHLPPLPELGGERLDTVGECAICELVEVGEDVSVVRGFNLMSE